jgi:2'-5' RNA ligase
MKRKAVIYWLLPAKPQRELFYSVIRILGKGFGAPNFEPHLTLFATTGNRESPKKVLQRIRARPIRLSARGVAFSSAFTKTLFIQFKSSLALRKIVADIGRAAKSPAKAPRDPHLSLLYKRLPRAAKKELASVMRLPFRSTLFDSIAAVQSTLTVRTGADVRKWKLIAKKSLRR